MGTKNAEIWIKGPVFATHKVSDCVGVDVWVLNVVFVIFMNVGEGFMYWEIVINCKRR